MAVFSFKQVSTSDPVLTKIQSNCGDLFRFLGNEEILGGHLLSDVFLNNSGKLIEHTLGRPAKGYILTKSSANANVWDEESSNTMKEQFLKLKSSADVTVSLWVF